MAWVHSLCKHRPRLDRLKGLHVLSPPRTAEPSLSASPGPAWPKRHFPKPLPKCVQGKLAASPTPARKRRPCLAKRTAGWPQAPGGSPCKWPGVKPGKICCPFGVRNGEAGSSQSSLAGGSLGFIHALSPASTPPHLREPLKPQDTPFHPSWLSGCLLRFDGLGLGSLPDHWAGLNSFDVSSGHSFTHI